MSSPIGRASRSPCLEKTSSWSDSIQDDLEHLEDEIDSTFDQQEESAEQIRLSMLDTIHILKQHIPERYVLIRSCLDDYPRMYFPKEESPSWEAHRLHFKKYLVEKLAKMDPNDLIDLEKYENNLIVRPAAVRYIKQWYQAPLTCLGHILFWELYRFPDRMDDAIAFIKGLECSNDVKKEIFEEIIFGFIKKKHHEKALEVAERLDPEIQSKAYAEIGAQTGQDLIQEALHCVRGLSEEKQVRGLLDICFILLDAKQFQKAKEVATCIPCLRSKIKMLLDIVRCLEKKGERAASHNLLQDVMRLAEEMGVESDLFIFAEIAVELYTRSVFGQAEEYLIGVSIAAQKIKEIDKKTAILKSIISLLASRDCREGALSLALNFEEPLRSRLLYTLGLQTLGQDLSSVSDLIRIIEDDKLQYQLTLKVIDQYQKRGHYPDANEWILSLAAKAENLEDLELQALIYVQLGNVSKEEAIRYYTLAYYGALKMESPQKKSELLQRLAFHMVAASHELIFTTVKAIPLLDIKVATALEVVLIIHKQRRYGPHITLLNEIVGEVLEEEDEVVQKKLCQLIVEKLESHDAQGVLDGGLVTNSEKVRRLSR